MRASRPMRPATPSRPCARFDAALRGGALNPQQVARALYYRGLVYRKDGKPGLAISDLTSAIWLKDGLVSGREAARHEAPPRRL